MTYVATLRPDSPRADAWREMFGSTSIPVRSPIAQLFPVEGRGEVWVVMLDLGALSPTTLDRLVAYCARGGRPPSLADLSSASLDLVRENLRRYGMPIQIEEDLDVTLGSVELLGLLGRAGLVALHVAPPPGQSFGLFGPLGPRGQG